jgi:hypothetical protein
MSDASILLMECVVDAAAIVVVDLPDLASHPLVGISVP